MTQLKPNCANIAERNLIRQGFETYYPEYEVSVRRANKYRMEKRPVFPGYMFVAFDPEDYAWRTINNTYGVSRLIVFGNQKPSPVPLGLISAIKSRYIDGNQFSVPETHLKPGEIVEITSGPFTDFIATIESLAPQQRVWVLLDILGGKTRISVPTDSIKLAS